MDRRDFLKSTMALGASMFAPSVFAAGFWEQPRLLWLRRAQTGEEVKLTYYKDGRIVTDGYHKICTLLRDTHENKAVLVDPVLLDIMRGVYGYFLSTGYDLPIIVNSGFRTARTNRKLWSEGAARNSMHLYGKAVDFKMPYVPPEYIARLGVYFRKGGVGLYEKSGFTHLDTGNLRTWRG